MPKLHVVVVSTRPGRVGLPVAQWTVEQAVAHGGFEVELVDLADMNLPLLDEPNHPRMSQYTREHTERWSAKVSEADAFVFVTPEYNYGPPPTLINALDYLYNEWLYKPCAFVSYGGVAAGLRSVQALKPVVTTLRMMPIPEGVGVPFVFQALKDGRFEPAPPIAAAAGPMLDELLAWTNALADLRNSAPPPPPPPPPGAPGGPLPSPLPA